MSKESSQKKGKAVTSQVPEEIVALVVSLSNSRETSEALEEARQLLPSPEVVEVILAEVSGKGEASVSVVDQALAWIKDQRIWQDRAMKVQAEIQRREPLSRSDASEGKLPGWIVNRWATEILYDWSEGLKDAVVQAESYLRKLEVGESR